MLNMQNKLKIVKSIHVSRTLPNGNIYTESSSIDSQGRTVLPNTSEYQKKDWELIFLQTRSRAKVEVIVTLDGVVM